MFVFERPLNLWFLENILTALCFLSGVPLCACVGIFPKSRYSIFELSDGSSSIVSFYSFYFLWLLIRLSLSAH